MNWLREYLARKTLQGIDGELLEIERLVDDFQCSPRAGEIAPLLARAARLLEWRSQTLSALSALSANARVSFGRRAGRQPR